MPNLDTATIDDIERRYPEAVRPNRRRQAVALAVVAALIGYFSYLYAAFDVAGVIEKARADRLALLTLDTYAHKIHVEVDFRQPKEISASLEGSRREAYETPPAWVSGRDGRYVVDMGENGRFEIAPGRIIVTDRTGGQAEMIVGNGERADPLVVSSDLPYLLVEDSRVPMLDENDAPVLNAAGEARTQLARDFVIIDGATREVLAEEPRGVWLKAAANKIEIRLGLFARATVKRGEIEIFRYFTGWENFWFGFHHPLNGASLGEVWAAGVADGPVADDQGADQSNWAYIFDGFWRNPEWQHGEVWFAMALTVLMAFIGTLLASIFGLPLAFLAARNMNPVWPLQLAVKKFLDFLRAVDMLIWSLIFIRAFGQGPLSGALAIFFTDTGTLGKLYAEAIENADRKQVEGTASVGAGPVQRNYFGVVPQILPVFISQALYFLESNTRSATIIGLLGAGGIGLKLAEAIRTGTDWENTAYMIVLIILVVIAMDNISSAARRRLIKGASPDLAAEIRRQATRRPSIFTRREV